VFDTTVSHLHWAEDAEISWGRISGGPAGEQDGGGPTVRVREAGGLASRRPSERRE